MNWHVRLHLTSFFCRGKEEQERYNLYRKFWSCEISGLSLLLSFWMPYGCVAAKKVSGGFSAVAAKNLVVHTVHHPNCNPLLFNIFVDRVKFFWNGILHRTAVFQEWIGTILQMLTFFAHHRCSLGFIVNGFSSFFPFKNLNFVNYHSIVCLLSWIQNLQVELM